MLKRICVLAVLLLSTLQANSYELILPTQKNSITNSNYAHFVGKAQNSESIMINGERVFPASNGAFAHSVKLKEGENRVLIRSNYSTQVYRFNKKIPACAKPPELEEFEIKPMLVKQDNTPLRNTPVDAGLNRIAHLFKDTTVLINGEKGEFYRVFLAKEKIAWIAKKDLIEPCDESSVGTFINMDSQKFKNATVQTISFTKNLPYTVEVKDKEILFRIYNPEFSTSSVYTLNIPKPEKYFYHVSLDNGQYTFKVSMLTKSLEDVTVAIDAGHGGTEKGAIGCLGNMEKDINLNVALELQKQLQNLGVNVVMTRECDGNMSLNDRVKLAKDNNVDIFISIHHNSIGDVKFNTFKHKGTSVYYFNPNSKHFAEVVEKHVTKSAGTHKDGVKTASFAVIRPVDYIGVLVETSYMINPSDSVLYNAPDYAHNVAKGIVESVVEYVGK